MERVLPKVDPQSTTKDRDQLIHSAIKSASAGVAGAGMCFSLQMHISTISIYYDLSLFLTQFIYSQH